MLDLLRGERIRRVAPSRRGARRLGSAGVTTDDLSRDQMEALARVVTRQQRFFNALIRRMDRRGFEPSDPLHRLSVQAQSVLQNLRMHLHYATCQSGVGKLAKSERVARDRECDRSDR
jgi:hypothetical protein